MSQCPRVCAHMPPHNIIQYIFLIFNLTDILSVILVKTLDDPEAPADSMLRALDEDAGVKKPFDGTFLDTVVRDIVLLRRRVRRVGQRELHKRAWLSSQSQQHKTSCTYFEHREVVVALAVRTQRDRGVRRRVHDFVQQLGVLRVPHGERAVVPVDLDGEVVPRVVREGRLEEEVQRMVPHFEVVSAGARERACGILKGRACIVGFASAPEMPDMRERQYYIPSWILNTCEPSEGSMNTIWYSCERLSGLSSFFWIETWKIVLFVSMRAFSSVCSPLTAAMMSVRRNPNCSPPVPGRKTELLSIDTEMTCSRGSSPSFQSGVGSLEWPKRWSY